MSFIICKDCGGQFRSPHPEGKIGEFSEYAQTLGKSVTLVSCMDRCEKNKISILKISAPDIKQNINSLTIDETFLFIKSY
jgi:hypothetical protein